MSPRKTLAGFPLFVALFVFFILNAVLVGAIYFLWK